MSLRPERVKKTIRRQYYIIVLVLLILSLLDTRLKDVNILRELYDHTTHLNPLNTSGIQLLLTVCEFFIFAP